MIIDKAKFGLTGLDYYVAPWGSDSNKGLNPSAPFQSLQKAADLINPGGTIYAMGGVHQNVSGTDLLALYVTGTPDNWIRITAFPGDSPKLKAVDGDAIASFGGSYVIIDGVEIEGNNQDVTLAYAESQQEVVDDRLTNSNGVHIHPNWDGDGNTYAHHVIIQNCTIHHFSGGGIATNLADYVRVENNAVHNNCLYSPWGQSGISFFKNSNMDTRKGYRMVALGNRCYRNQNLIKFINSGGTPAERAITDGNGIIVDTTKEAQSIIAGSPVVVPYAGQVLVQHNRCYRNGGRGINIFKSVGADVIDNICYQNAETAGLNGEISAFQNNRVTILNNILYTKFDDFAVDRFDNDQQEIDYNLIHNTSISLPLANNNVSGDPLFGSTVEGAEDFSYGVDSPAVGFRRVLNNRPALLI